MSKSLEQLAQEWLVISQHLDSHGTACFLIEERLAENERLKEALEQVVDWKMPESNKTWDDGSPMSYGAAFGSNGERDYIRGIAKAALEGGDGRIRSAT